MMQNSLDITGRCGSRDEEAEARAEANNGYVQRRLQGSPYSGSCKKNKD